MKDWIEASSKPLAALAAITAIVAALIWHISANTQESLSLATNTTSDQFKAALAASLRLNSYAAIVSALSAVLSAVSVIGAR